jgi:type IV pilus assembly protein PilO
MISLTKQQKKAVITTVIAGVVILGFTSYLYFMLGKKSIAVKTAQIEKNQEKIEILNAQLKEMDELAKLQGRFSEIETRLDQISRRLPSTPEAPGFLNALSAALRATGISTKKLAPTPENAFDRFTEIPYKIDAVGRYHEIGQFLTLVEENPQRFMRVKSLKIENDKARPSLHPVTVGIATFMFVEK